MSFHVCFIILAMFKISKKSVANAIDMWLARYIWAEGIMVVGKFIGNHGARFVNQNFMRV